METQEHIVNCVGIKNDNDKLDIKLLLQEQVPEENEAVREIARRFILFEEITKC